MVVRISDKTQNYSKVTKLLVKPFNYYYCYMKVARNFLSLRKANEMSCYLITNVETIRVESNINYSFIYSLLCVFLDGFGK